MQTRNVYIDLAKYIAALLVIAIHTRPLKEISSNADFYFVDIICRLAVPFFAVCTGFYLMLAIKQDQQIKPAIKILRKIVAMYIGWTLFYLFIHLHNWYSTGTFTQENVIGWMKATVVSTSYFHLWYLSALIYALPFFILAIKFIPPKYLPFIFIPLWIYQVVSYGYLQFCPTSIQPLFCIQIPFEALLTGLTRMLPLLLVGSWLADRDITSASLKKSYTFTIGLLVLLTLEATNLRNLGGNKFSYIVFILPLAAAVFCCLYLSGESRKFNSRYLANISMTVYCLHPAILYLLRDVFNMRNNLWLFIWVSLITTLLSAVYYQLKNSTRK